jgi:hypothetical protein
MTLSIAKHYESHPTSEVFGATGHGQRCQMQHSYPVMQEVRSSSDQLHNIGHSGWTKWLSHRNGLVCTLTGTDHKMYFLRDDLKFVWLLLFQLFSLWLGSLTQVDSFLGHCDPTMCF